MSKRREVQKRLSMLGEIEGIMVAMKNLALLEAHKLETFVATQRRAVTSIETAAQDLASHCTTIVQRLQMVSPAIAFAGGLLETPNLLSNRLCALLDIPEIPITQYPPVVGAALLAQINLGEQST